MSAIFGLVHLSGQPVDLIDLERMGSALEAYGTDDSGIWHKGNVGMGHQLMRFTPEDLYEKQPLADNTGRILIVTDGRIDNRVELVYGLQLATAEIDLLPDSAFILNAYDKWGTDCLSHLTGSFVFAIWNEYQETLFLACSQMGERPLYYHVTQDRIAFASMPKGLFVLPYIPRQIDNNYLADYLTDSYIEPSRSWYSGINRLPFGHAMLISPKEQKVWRYWQPENLSDIRFKKDEDYAEAFGSLLERIVADQCRSVSPVGVMLSGGFDSTTVAAIAAVQLQSKNKRLAGFTEVPRIGFNSSVINGRYPDETQLVQAMSEKCSNLDTTFIRTDGRFFLDKITDFFSAAEMPFRNSSNRGWIEAIYKNAKNKNVRILLTGTQGNLTISWNGRGLLPQLISSGHFMRAIQEAGYISRQHPARPLLRVLLSHGVFPLLPGALYRAILALRHPGAFLQSTNQPWNGYSPIRTDFARKHNVVERAHAAGWNFHSQPIFDTKAIRLLMFGLSSPIADFAAAYKAIYGIETRDVPADSRLVEFCMRIPEDQWLQKGVDRSLLRRTMRGRLPEKVLQNRQRGLQAADWMNTLQGTVPAINQELVRLRKSSLAKEAIDFDRLDKLATALPHDNNDPMQQTLDYRNTLQRGLMVGRFLYWFETGD